MIVTSDNSDNLYNLKFSTLEYSNTLDPVVAVAQAWRLENGYQHRKGVVVIYEGKVQGWVDNLRDPGHWVPGCIAVDEKGNRWCATGGDEFHGADSWAYIGSDYQANDNSLT